MMAKEHIIISQSVLKDLESDTYTLYKLISEIENLVLDLKQNWGCLSALRKHFKQELEIEED
jgi:hypothetical protein